MEKASESMHERLSSERITNRKKVGSSCVNGFVKRGRSLRSTFAPFEGHRLFIAVSGEGTM